MAIKYCPECGAEYQEWAEKCLDCNVALVDEKPERKNKSKDTREVVTKGGRKYVKEPLLAIGSFTNQLEAQINKGILEYEGIESLITSNDSLIAYQPDTSAVGNIQLVVKESDAEKAKEILNSIEKDIPEGEFPAEGFIEEIPIKETPQ